MNDLEKQIDAEVKRLGYLSWSGAWVSPVYGEKWYQVKVISKSDGSGWCLGKEGTEEESLIDTLKFLKKLKPCN